MTRCPTCHQSIRSSKPPSANYKLFPSSSCGVDMMWVVPTGDRWKDKPYMHKHLMFPHQIKVAV